MSPALPYKHLVDIAPLREGEEAITVRTTIDLTWNASGLFEFTGDPEPGQRQATIDLFKRRNESALGAAIARRLSEGTVTDKPINPALQCTSCGYGRWPGAVETHCSACGAAF